MIMNKSLARRLEKFKRQLLDELKDSEFIDIFDNIEYYAGMKEALEYLQENANSLPPPTIQFLAGQDEALTLLGHFFQGNAESLVVKPEDVSDFLTDNIRDMMEGMKNTTMDLASLRKSLVDKVNNSFQELEVRVSRMKPSDYLLAVPKIHVAMEMRKTLLHEVLPKTAAHLIMFDDPLHHCCTEWEKTYGSTLGATNMVGSIHQLIGMEQPLTEDMDWPSFIMKACDLPPEQVEAVLNVKLNNPENGSSLWLPFPASHDSFAKALHGLGVSKHDTGEVEVDSIITRRDGLPYKIPALQKFEDYNELNLAAYVLSGIDEQAAPLVKAIIECEYAPHDTASLINTLCNLDTYELIKDVTTHEQLAVTIASEYGLTDPSEADFDATEYGRYIADHFAKLSPFGYVFHAQGEHTVYWGQPEYALHDEWMLQKPVLAEQEQAHGISEMNL